MRVNYYILRNGVLRRKQNTVYFMYKKDAGSPKRGAKIFESETEGGGDEEDLNINCFNPQKPRQNSFPVLTQEFKR